MIDTAVILAAGQGTRLRPQAPYKPLCRVAGKPLLDHALEGLHRAGLSRALVVTGYGAEAIEQHVARRKWPLRVETIRNPDWELPNGVSARTAAAATGGQPVLLAMCDHLVDPALYRRMAEAGAGPGLRLGIDRRLESERIDPDDVTRVRTEGALIREIGKGIDDYDCYDTGVFAVAQVFFDALAGLAAPSITDGVRLLVAEDRAEVIECSDLDWFDVDDGAALAMAELAPAHR